MKWGRIVLVMIVAAAATARAIVQSPEVLHVGVVAPDIIGITVQAGRAEYGGQIVYRRDPGDHLVEGGHNRWIMRHGKWYGFLIGKERKTVYTTAKVTGASLNEELAREPASYTIQSRRDKAYRNGLAPVKVHRKSKPSDYAQVGPWKFKAPRRHVIYLRLPAALKPGESYRIKFADGFLPGRVLRYEPEKIRSEAVHVSHVGFRPNDPAKVAFLSCWLGDGGPLKYPKNMGFRVLEDKSGKVRFKGPVRRSKPASEKDEDGYKKNYSGVDVHEMDFSALQRPGRYRVCVDGVGCSYPFEISEDAWREAFRTSVRGFYHQRSGIKLEPPYTDFKRPRPFHPDDGVVIYHSKTPLMDSGNGLNARGTDEGNFGNLVKGGTKREVKGLWGGLMDAGDWDRRIQHLIATRFLLDLAEMFPEFYSELDLNIPESGRKFKDSGKRVPDIVSEALFNLEFYRRCQEPDGGVRGGVESEEHPRHGEASWQESLTIYAYAPGVWSSHLFAATAARMARYLSRHDLEAAAGWRRDALRAMEWAEKELPKRPKGDPHGVNDARNLAAAELYRLTEEKRWHDLFAETTAFQDPKANLFVWKNHEQAENAWVYLNTDRGLVDPALRKNCLAALVREADDRVACVGRTGFRWAKDDYKPGTWGPFTLVQSIGLVWAHRLTGDEKYLKAAVLACQYGLGANPVNLCYTTGLGHEWPRHPLHIDSRITSQEPPEGITVFGPSDTGLKKDEWDQKLADEFCYPPAWNWPTLEAFWDVFWYPSMCEFTPQHPMAHTSLVWGYLAARE